MSDQFDKLVAVMRTLRSPEGCPWDRDQTLDTLTHFVLEEAYEVVDAIERGDMEAVKEEIGDHIFEGVFLAQVAAEDGRFTVEDALRTVVEKLVRLPIGVFYFQRPTLPTTYKTRGEVGLPEERQEKERQGKSRINRIGKNFIQNGQLAVPGKGGRSIPL